MIYKYTLGYIPLALKIKCLLLFLIFVSLGSLTFVHASNPNQPVKAKTSANIINPGLDPVIILSQNTATLFAAANSTTEVNVTSNITWSASSDQLWLTVSPSSATGNGTLTFTAAANGGSSRTATVTVSGTGLTDQTIVVSQLAEAPSLSFASSSSGSLSIGLQFNANGSFYIDWGNGSQDLKTATKIGDTYSTSSYISGHVVKIYGAGITNMTASSMNLTWLDVTQCPEMSYLNLAFNSLTTLDVSSNTKLSNLNCSYNSLSSIDVRWNSMLNELRLAYNNLGTLNVSNNSVLTYLDCSSNKIATLDISNLTTLTKLFCNSNKIALLDVSKNVSLSVLNCNINNLNFVTLPQRKAQYSSYSYTPQARIPATINGNIVDLSRQLSVNDINNFPQTTVYKWYTKPGVQLVAGTDYKESNGVFTFQNTPADSVYCTMTNTAFPVLTSPNALRTVNVKVQLVFPQVSTSTVNMSNVGSTQADVSGDLIDFGIPDPTNYGICWNTTGSPLTTDSKVNSVVPPAIGPFTVTMGGLTAYTTYYLRAFATNLAGTAYGNEVTFTTNGLLPSITTNPVTNISITKATCNGSIVNLGAPNPTQYGFVWDTNPNPTIALPTIDNKGAIAVTGPFTSNIAGLTANMKYYVRAFATNTVGTAYGVEDVFFTTQTPTIDAPNPLSLSGFSTTVGTASVSKTFTIGGTLSAPLVVTAPTGYEVRESGIGSFAASVSFTPDASEIVATKTIEVRIKSSAPLGAVSGNVDCTSLGAPTRSVPVDGNVLPIQLTITSPTVSPTKVYDGTSVSNITPGTVSGILPGDVGNVTVTPLALYDNANASTGKTVTISYSLSGPAALNYLAPLGTTATADITPAPVSVIAVTDTKVYTGTTTSGGTPTIGTLISGDVANMLPTQVFDTPNAGTTHVLIPSGLTLKNAANADVTTNYLISYVNSPATGVISQLGVTVTAIPDSKIYNGTTNSIGIPLVGSLLAGDVVANQPIQVFDTPEIGKAHQLIPSGLTIQDAANADVTANYQITYINSQATGVIDKLVITVTAVPTTKTYNATTVSNGTPVVSSLATGDAVSTSPIQVYDNSNYGTAHMLIPSGLTIKNGSNVDVTGNYTINYQNSPATGVINKFDVTVTGVTDTKPYDGTTVSSAHPLVGSLLGTDVVDFAPIQVFDSPGVGTLHVLIPSGLTIKDGSNDDVTANYAVNYINSPATGTINKLGITVTGVTDTKNYDGTVSSSASPIVGFLASGDAVSAAPVQMFDTPEVGTTHVLIPSGLTIKDGSNTYVTGNYTITYINSPATGVISKLSVTVTAISDAKPFDKTTSSAGNPSVGQLAPGDVVSTSPVQVFDTPNVGTTHILIPSGLAIKNGSNVDVTANYTINYVNSPATGMITKLNVSVTAVIDTKTYTGNTFSAGSPVVGALLAGDVVNQLPTQVFDTPDAGTTHVLIPSGLTIKDGSNADVTANYAITYINSPATGIINQLGVTVTAVTDTKTYDGTNVSIGVPVVGLLLAGNTVSVQPKQVFDTPGFGITHALIPSGLSIKDGSNADITNNYAINYVNSPATGVINPLGITVTAVTDTKTYDGTVSSAASPIVGMLASGDMVNVAPVQVFDTPVTGTTHILTPSGLTLKDAGNNNVTGNYAITYINSPATGVINKMVVNVTAVTDTKFYDATVISTAAPVVGPLGAGDVVNIAPVQVFDSPVIGNTHALTASGLTIKNGSNADMTGNYTILYVNSPATGIINKLPLTVTAVTDTKTYNGTTVSMGVPVVGVLFAGDVVNMAPVQVFDTPDAGNTHVLIPSGLTIKDGSNADVTDHYLMTYVNSPATGVINKLAVTVTAVTDTKTYDGNNSSTGNPLVGVLLAGEVVSVTPSQVFDTPDIGNTHVLIPSGLVVVNGSNADVTHNYAINYVNSPATGVINKKNLTVTAVADTKIYDGTVNSSVAPLVSPLAASDVVSVAPVQVFDSPFVGSSHTLTASGLTIKDGSNADVTGNYNITYVSSPATGVIDKLVVTVTAVLDTKTYDATVNSSVVPLIGLLGIGDVPNTVPVQVYDSPNAGNTHVLSPSGLSVKNGSNVDVSANYTIIYVNTPATGIINKYNVSVTAVMDTKTYDATVTSAGVPVVGVLLAGQLVKAVPTQVFDDPNAGTSHVLIPSGLTVKDGGNADVTDNYAIAYVNSPATGVINKFNVTVTAVTDTRIYDGTAVSVGVPVVGTLLVGQVVNAYPIQMFDTPEVGNTHLLIVSGLTVQNSSNTDVTGNYAINYVNSPTGVITKRDLTVTAVTDSKTYDATVGSVVSPLVGALATGDVVNAAPVQVFDTPLPGTAHVLTPSGLTIKDGSNVDATGNYRISYMSSPATGIITTRVLTISDPIISTHKVLDGNTTVQVTPGVITGLALADVGNVTLIAAANYDNPNLGTDKTITVVYSLIGSAAGNYTAPADYVIHSGIIGPMTLTLSNPSINTVKEYDGSNSVIYSLGELSGLDPADATNVILTSSASYDNANAGAGKTITVTYGLSGSLAGHYIVPPAYTITTGVITPKQLVVVSLKITTNKVYDSTNAATFTVGDLTGVVPLDAGNVTLAGTAVYDNANVGTGKNITVSYTLSGSAIANYTVPSSYTITNGVIKAKQLTIADPVVMTNKMVDGFTGAVIKTLGTLQGIELPDANNVSFTATANYDTKNVGVNKLITIVYTLNGSAMGNYITPVDFIITGAKISDFVVLSPLITPTNGCEGTAIDLAYDIVTGTPTQYKIILNATALAAGIRDVSYTSLLSTGASGILPVVIPAGTVDGTYHGTLQFRNELGVESPVYDFQFTINVSTDYIISKFDDVVLIDNSSNRFVAYQWYKDGLAIHAATKQFYNDLDGLVGAYSAKLITVDGQTLYTCPKVLNIPLAKSVSVFPSPVKKNQVSTIKLTGMTDTELEGADLSVYTMQGTRVYQSSRVQKVNSINLPPIAGMYVGRVKTSRGQEMQFKVIVIE